MQACVLNVATFTATGACNRVQTCCKGIWNPPSSTARFDGLDERAAVQELRQLIFDRAIKHVALTLALRFEIDGHLRALQTQDERATLLHQLELARGIEHRIDRI